MSARANILKSCGAAVASVCQRHTLRAFFKEQRGATSIEYSLIVGMIFLVIVGSVRAYVNGTSEMYSEIESAINE